MSEAIAVTLEVTEVLHTLKIRYLIAGSLAGSVYGNPRATRDTMLGALARSVRANSKWAELNLKHGVIKTTH
jgi:hypothetical protein